MRVKLRIRWCSKPGPERFDGHRQVPQESGRALNEGALPRAQVSDEAERSVLVKLKTECGYQFTSKLESMFTDIKTSRDTMQEYKARRQASANGEDDVELAVQVPAPALSSPHSISAHDWICTPGAE